MLAAAHGGTVFLDEIGELVPEAQAMLLRFLQSGEGRAVGATATTHVDVRIIAATHRDLEDAVERAAFREDLYYRLRRVVLSVPPLRERAEDIALLVEHVRRRVNARYGLAVVAATREVLDTLVEHRWPGNIRELEAVVEQAMILQRDGWLTAAHLELAAPRWERTAVQPALGNKPHDGQADATLRRQRALQLAASRGSISRRDLCVECRISGEQARLDLTALTQRGQLRRVGGGRNTRYVLA